MIENDFVPRTAGLAARQASAACAGIAFGIVTLWLQGRLDGNWNVLANSGAVWTVVAVAAAAVLGTSAASAATAGLLALVGEVGGYYWCAAPWHGVAVTGAEQILWTAAAVVIGPFAGLAGHALARGTNTHRALALLCVAGVLAGEGLYTWRYIPNLRPAAAAELAVAVGTGVATLAFSTAPLRTRFAAVALGVVVALLVLVAYHDPIVV